MFGLTYRTNVRRSLFAPLKTEPLNPPDEVKLPLNVLLIWCKENEERVSKRERDDVNVHLNVLLIWCKERKRE